MQKDPTCPPSKISARTMERFPGTLQRGSSFQSGVVCPIFTRHSCCAPIHQFIDPQAMQTYFVMFQSSKVTFLTIPTYVHLKCYQHYRMLRFHLPDKHLQLKQHQLLLNFRYRTVRSLDDCSKICGCSSASAHARLPKSELCEIERYQIILPSKIFIVRKLMIGTWTFLLLLLPVDGTSSIRASSDLNCPFFRLIRSLVLEKVVKKAVESIEASNQYNFISSNPGRSDMSSMTCGRFRPKSSTPDF